MPKNNFFDDQNRFVPDQILDYLNSTGTTRGLKEALVRLNFFLRTKIMSAELTGDSVPDVVLDLTFQPFEGSVLLVFGCRNRQYVTLYNESFLDDSKAFVQNANDASVYLTGVQAIRDMNGDGTAEIVYDYLPNIGTHGYGWIDYSILEWDGSAFVDLADQNTDSYGDVTSDIVQFDDDSSFIRDHGDGTSELVITQRPQKDFHYGGGEAERKREMIYAWNGVHFTQFCWRYTEPPKYIADAVMDGDNESNCRHFDTALRFYEQAIFNHTLLPWNNLEDYGYDQCCVSVPTLVPDPNERTVLEAYARYRIVVLHAVQNQVTEATTDLSILTQKYGSGQPGGVFVGLAQAFWNSYSTANNVVQGCRSAIAYAEAHPEIAAVFSKYTFNGTFSTNAFALSDNIQQICPFK